MKKFTLLICSIYSTFLSAQLQFDSFDQLMSYADEHSVSIKASMIQNDIQNNKLKESKAYMYPNIASQYGFTDFLDIQPTLIPSSSFDQIAPDDAWRKVRFGKEYYYSIGFHANWDILNFQKKFAAQTSKIEAEATKANIDRTKYNTYNQLASVYYSIILNQESIKIYEENVKVFSDLLQIAQDRYDSGIISESDLNRAKIQDLENRKVLDSANSSLDQLYAQLQSQLNTNEEIQIIENAEFLGTDILDFSNTHPEIRFQEIETGVYESQLKQAKSARYPVISFQYQKGFNWAGEEFMNFSNLSNLSYQMVGFKINMQLFDGFARKSRIKSAEQLLDIQKLEFESTKLNIQKQDEILRMQYNQSIENLEKSQQILDLQTSNDHHSENKYNSGIIGLDQRLDNYEDLLDAQSRYLQNLSDFILAQYKVNLRKINF